MDEDKLGPSPITLRTRLEAVIAQMPNAVSAVVDGSHFDDVARRLAELGLPAKSLFLGERERDVQRFGPWLVEAARPGDFGRVLDLVGDRPAAVFWSCPDGPGALYDHLRRLNLVRMPAAPPADAAERSTEAAAPAYETVLFRHWDPRVLSVVLPALDEMQFSRVLGPCAEAAYIDPVKYGGAAFRRVKRFSDLPIAPRGMLSLNPDQVAALDQSMEERSRRKAAVYLTDVAPAVAGHLSPADLNGRVMHAEQTGRALGITGERARLKWAYLMLITDGQVATAPQVTAAIASGGKSPDHAVDIIMRQVVRAARTRDGG